MSVKLQYLNIFTDHRDMGLLIGEKSKGDRDHHASRSTHRICAFGPQISTGGTEPVWFNAEGRGMWNR